ncbi:hypothetical protein niasHS_009152 [Heterodera schachtii]|uniref:Ephrin RBD domain-containing protein n=1 Tax=Heterodera schachtii TaxID=97005 RepID=A0ABD2JE08_HETSC
MNRFGGIVKRLCRNWTELVMRIMMMMMMYVCGTSRRPQKSIHIHFGVPILQMVATTDAAGTPKGFRHHRGIIAAQKGNLFLRLGWLIHGLISQPGPLFGTAKRSPWVSRESYDQCMLQGIGTKQLGVCSSPERQSSITLVFRDVSPLPSAFTFRPGQSYFVITTSNGTLMGLNNTEGGLCATRNMRLKFDVLSLADEADANNDTMLQIPQPHHAHAHHHHHHHQHHHQQRYHHKALVHKQQETHSSIQNESSNYPPFLYVIHTSEMSSSPHGGDEDEGEEAAAAWGQDSYETGDENEMAYYSSASSTFTLIRKHCVVAVFVVLITCWTNKIICCR